MQRSQPSGEKILLFQKHFLAGRSALYAFVAAAILSACGAEIDPEPEVAVDAAVAVRVNGSPIFISDIELEAVARGLISPGDDFNSEHEQYDRVLDELIDQKLLSQEALRLDLPDEPSAERRLAQARERILGNLMVEHLVALEVNEETIEAMYQEQVALQQTDDEVSLSHILVATEDDAQRLYDEIQAGAAFETLVAENSLDTATRMERGSLGFVAPNTLPRPFPLVVANTQVGEVSEPFESADGWHILKVKDRRSTPPKTREEMRPEIVTFLTLNEMSRLLRRLRTEAEIDRGELRGRAQEPEAAEDLPVSEAGQEL